MARERPYGLVGPDARPYGPGEPQGERAGSPALRKFTSMSDVKPGSKTRAESKTGEASRLPGSAYASHAATAPALRLSDREGPLSRPPASAGTDEPGALARAIGEPRGTAATESRSVPRDQTQAAQPERAAPVPSPLPGNQSSGAASIDLTVIIARLEEMKAGSGALARRRDIVELYNKIKQTVDAVGQTAPAHAADLDTSKLVQHVDELRESVRSLEGLVHVSLERAIEKSVAKHVSRVASGRRDRSGLWAAVQLGLLGFLSVMATACFWFLVFMR